MLMVLKSLLKNGVDPAPRSVEKPRTVEDMMDRTKPWQLSEIVDAGQCRLVTMPDSTDAGTKVTTLLLIVDFYGNRSKYHFSSIITPMHRL